MQRRHNATRHLSLFSRSRRRARVLLRFKMTKLMQWLLCGVMFISVWFPLATNKLNNHVLEKYSDVIVLFPVFSLAFFGVSIVLPVLKSTNRIYLYVSKLPRFKSVIYFCYMYTFPAKFTIQEIFRPMIIKQLIWYAAVTHKIYREI